MHCRVSHFTAFYDLRNAFWSPPLTKIVGQIRVRCMGIARRLLLQHVTDLCLIASGDGVCSSQQALHNFFGTPPGGRFAAELFLDLIEAPVVDWWEKGQEAAAALGHSEGISATLACVEKRLEDVTITGFADDLARKHLLTRGSLSALHLRLARSDRDFDEALSDMGLAQNREKRVVSPAFYGFSSSAQTKRAYAPAKQLQAKVEYSARYLGPLISAWPTNVAEHDARLSQAKARFLSLRRCFKSLPKALALSLYKTAVLGTLFDAQVAMQASRHQLCLFDSVVARHLRALAQGSTTEWTGEGEDQQARRKSNREVFHDAKWHGAELELALQRLKLWQSVLRGADTEIHDQLLFVVFGNLSFETCDHLGPNGEI